MNSTPIVALLQRAAATRAARNMISDANSNVENESDAKIQRDDNSNSNTSAASATSSRASDMSEN